MQTRSGVAAAKAIQQSLLLMAATSGRHGVPSSSEKQQNLCSMTFFRYPLPEIISKFIKISNSVKLSEI